MERSFYLLAIDPAKHLSGSALLKVQPTGNAEVEAFLAVSTQQQRRFVVQQAVERAEAAKLPLVVVAETWDKPRGRDQKWTYKTILGIGEGWGLWAAELEHSKVRHVVRVTPNVWRDSVFGKHRPKDTEGLKAFALLYVQGRIRLHITDDNVCEAICIGFWGALAEPVLQMAEKVKV